MSLFNELKRRNVFKVGIGYIVVAWLVAQVLQLIFESFGTPDWVMKTVLVLLATGLPFALFFAWAFELTPDGIKREHEVDRSQSITSQTGRKLNVTITAVMALALAYFAYDKFVLSASREATILEEALDQATTLVEAKPEESVESDNSIAVLPFVNMSSDEEQEYFSDGLSEELLNLLAKIPELRVAARTSSFSFKGQNLEIPDIADRLKVAHILEGSVRKAGNQVRITAQLIKADDGFHLWSETYDRSLDNIFAIQDEIATEVVAQLKLTLLGVVPTVREIDPEAFALFLQARHLERLGSPEGFEQSITLLNQVLAIDPGYADAWAYLALCYLDQTYLGVIASEEGWVLAEDALNKALILDPDNAPALSRLAFLGGFKGADMNDIAKMHERALFLEPSNLIVLGNAATFLRRLGRTDEVIEIYEFSVGIDPVNTAGLNSLGREYLAIGRLDEALGLFRTILTLSPSRAAAHYNVGIALLLKAESELALAAFNQEMGDEEYKVKGTALALYALGRQDEFEAKLSELIERWGDQWPSEVAHVYAYTGDTDAAFQWLVKSAAEEEGAFYPYDPLLTTLHDDPRWQPLLEKIGSSADQLSAIEFKVTLPQ